MRKIALFTILAMSLAASAMAKQHKHPAGFTFWAPDDWEAKTEGKSVALIDKASEVLVVLHTPEGVKDMDQALKDLDKWVAQWVTDLKVGEPEKGKEEGVDYVMVEGSGKAGGEPVDLAVAIFHAEGDFLVAFGAVDAAKAATHEATVEKIIDSIEESE